MNPQIVELIYTETTHGEGTKDSPLHVVAQLWTKQGTLVAKGNSEKWPDGAFAAVDRVPMESR